jgi:hypothetical protein
MGDPQVMHYVVFLMNHGLQPYKQIGDMNMPGAYMAEQSALAVFGHTDLGWRLYDFSLAIITAIGMASIARRVDWIAGVFAALIFTFNHAVDGPLDAGQRDQVIAVLLVVSVALLFEAVRRHKSWLMFWFALLSALAVSIKPTVALAGPVLLLYGLWKLRREAIPIRTYLLWGIAGFFGAIAIVALFLVAHGSTDAFFHQLTTVIPHYSSLDPVPWSKMAALSLQKSLFALALLALGAAALLRDTPQRWEQNVVLLCTGFGALSYFAQHKGFSQHRYTFIAFLALWSCIQLTIALDGKGTQRRVTVAKGIGLLTIVFFFLYVLPRDLATIRRSPQYDNFTRYLEHDLNQIGPSGLQGNVQCFDIIDGCLTALFHLQILQNTGSTGDLLLFQPIAAPAVVQARENFWSAIGPHPPQVYIISNWQFGSRVRNFNKVETWPAFTKSLNTDYVFVMQREFRPLRPPTSASGTNPNIPGYRIYVRKDSPLLPSALRLEAPPDSSRRAP